VLMPTGLQRKSEVGSRKSEVGSRKSEAVLSLIKTAHQEKTLPVGGLLISGAIAIKSRIYLLMTVEKTFYLWMVSTVLSGPLAP